MRIKISQSFHDRNPIILYGEIMNRKFGAFMKMYRRETTLLSVSLMAGKSMATLSGYGGPPFSSNSEASSKPNS